MKTTAFERVANVGRATYRQNYHNCDLRVQCSIGAFYYHNLRQPHYNCIIFLQYT
jgi:hypothetical protein